MRAFVPALLVSFLSAASAVRFGAASGLTLKAPSPAVGDAPPDFCRGLACPKYTTVNSSETWELREYAPADWVSTVRVEADISGAGTSRDGKKEWRSFSGGAWSARSCLLSFSLVACAESCGHQLRQGAVDGAWML